jgi:nitroimidazol reductase NimA-like FMN-containing flavoprotein (pyridoxamine 5'-phosphate oxidase superfamily)
MSPSPASAPSARTQVKRGAIRPCYDRREVDAVHDEAFVCYVACAHEGQAYLIPMAYARLGDELLIHGSSANRVLRLLRDGAEATVSVMLLDGLVLARVAFHTSVNYRSVVVYGRAREITERSEKSEALRVIVEHAQPGRWEDVRPPNEQEFARTMVLAIPLAEASAKLRVGGPAEEEEDWELPGWAGVVPLRTVRVEPVACERLAPGTPLPGYLVQGGPRGSR